MSHASPTWSPERVVPVLEGVELFRGLDDGELRRVAGVVGYRSVAMGEVVFREGDPGDALYIVIEGAVEVRPPPSGDGAGAAAGTGAAILRRGRGFGEAALLSAAPRSATARAIVASGLMVVRRDDLRPLLDGDSLPHRLLDLAATHLSAAEDRPPAPDPDPRPRRPPPPDMDPEPVSRLLQRSMLTRDAPQVRGYDIAAGTTLEAEGRGSTVWDSIVLPDGREALVMMDVRADGLPPAHLLGAARVALRAALPGAADLATALATVNDALAAVHVEGVDQFVECALLVPGAEEIEWACAGRIPAAILGRDATFTRLGSHGPPLGMMKGFGYGTERAPLGSGSAVLVLSGGGPGLFRGAADLVAEVQGRPAGKVVGTIHRAIRRALEGQEISVVFMRRH